MKLSKFIKHVLIFLLPVFVVIILFEISLRNIDNDYLYKIQYLENHSNNIEVLFLGNSHAYRGINPEYISLNSFNAAYVSQSIDLDYEILKKIKPNTSNLKYIVIPISYSSLYGSLKSGKENWRLKNYCIYYGICLSSNIKNYFEILNFKPQTNILRLINFYQKNESPLTTDKNGYGITKGTKDLETSGINAAKRHTKENLNLYYENTAIIITNIISYAQEKNIKIIFYTPPAYYTYRNHLNNNQLKLTFYTLNRIANKNPSVYYYNFLADEHFLAEDFYNADHLNDKGAQKLTLKLNAIINNITN